MTYEDHDFKVMYNSIDDYETMEFSDGNSGETGYSLIFFNGIIASCAHTANSKEGWILTPSIFNIRYDNIRNDKSFNGVAKKVDVAKDENDDLIYNKLYGDVKIIKCNRHMIPITRIKE